MCHRPVLSAESIWIRLHRLAVAEFDFRLRQVMPEYWVASTPCEEWDVSELVRHVVVETLLVPEALAGRDPSILRAELLGESGALSQDVGADRADDDPHDEFTLADDAFDEHALLGEPSGEDFIDGDPALVWEDAHRAASAAFGAAELADVVGAVGGNFRVIDYLRERTADLLIHAWDLADAIGVDDRLDEEAVVAVYEWAKPHEDRFRKTPLHFDTPVVPEAGADLQSRLLGLFGRTG
jgi:uncharacterized protein (TIGR03086 family)